MVLNILFSIVLQLLANPYANWSNVKSEKTLQEGIRAVFNYDLIEAEKTFDLLCKLEPDRPEGYYYKSYVHFWRYIISEREKDYNKFANLNEIAIEVAQKYFNKNEGISARQALALFFLGESYTYKAVADARAGNFIKSGLNGSRAKGYYSDALSKNPKLYDALKGEGIFQFVISLIPGSLRWIVTALGYQGDRYGGLAMIRKAQKKGYYVVKELNFYLAIIDFYFFKKKDAIEKNFKAFLEKNPTSSLYLYSLGYLYYSRSNFKKAEIYFKRLYKNLERDPDDAFVIYGLYLLGETFYHKNDFKKALYYFTKHERTTRLQFFGARASYKVGVCYEMLGNRSEAKKYFKSATVSIDVISEEVYSKRKSREYAKKPIPQSVKYLIQLYNCISSRQSKKTKELLQKLESMRLSKDAKSEFYYKRGIYYQTIGKTDQAIQDYKKAASLFPKIERQFPPLSTLALGKLYLSMGKKKEAMKAFRKAEKYNAYDYEVTVRREVSLLRDRIKHKH